MSTVLWLRRDLRRADHPALLAAVAAAQEQAAEVAVVFVIDPVLWSSSGPVRRAWLAANLDVLGASYELIVRYGDPVAVLPELAREVGATSVHVTRETTPYGRRRDEKVADALAASGIDWVVTGTPYVFGPGTVRTKEDRPFKVFTPFARRWRELDRIAPAEAPDAIPSLVLPDAPVAAAALASAVSEARELGLPDAGEAAALSRWRAFLDEGLANYANERDRPDHMGTSGLSPYLKVGAIHPRTLLADLAEHTGPGAASFMDELAWREFYADVLWHHPGSAWADLTPTLRAMEYDAPDARVEAWRLGRTGFPIVDAGMRQLAATGWMHNRVRMITASFLTKDLHAWWPVGARHFLDQLIDGDIASNNHGWQWVAGTGTDASPYFRVFNPITQGQRFDPQGDYVRQWIPELRHLTGKVAHTPWTHPEGHAFGYPEPIVDHAEERVEALRRYQNCRSASAQ